MAFLHLIYAYLLGGVTFIPAAIAVFIYLHANKATKNGEIPLRAGSIEESRDSGLNAFKQGWIVVTHEELESQDDISGRSETVGETPEAKSAYSSLYKLVTNTKVAVRAEKRDTEGSGGDAKEHAFKEDTFTLREPPGADLGDSESIRSSARDQPRDQSRDQVGEHSRDTREQDYEKSRDGQDVRDAREGQVRPAEVHDSPIPSSNTTPASAPSKKHRYYAVLKHGNLFLYKNERMQDVKHVIVLHNHIVTLWPRNLSEASLFTKYSSIALLKSDWSRARRLSENRPESGSDWHSGKVTTQDVLDHTSGLSAPPGAIFIYTDYNVDKEDWYFALIRATKTAHYATPALDPSVYAETLHFPTANSMKLIQALYSSEGQLQTKWLNSILGRLFLSLQKTDIMQDYLTLKIEKKLNKIKTPGFLDKFQIIHVDAGNSAPLISYPVLKEMNPEGNLLVSFDMHYSGGLSMQLATKVNINLGSRFKTREVDVLLSITFEKISGPMLIRMKPPPSTRIWYTFESEPQMAIKIEPVISSRSMSYGVITNTIEKKFKDAIKESLVFPHWDDIVFYSAKDEMYRGGLWDKSVRPTETESTNDAEKERGTDGADKNDTKVGETTEGKKGDGEESERSEDVSSVFTAGSDDNMSFSSATAARSKARISATLNDLSKRLRKPKSASTLGVDETSILSDGSEVQSVTSTHTSSVHSNQGSSVNSTNQGNTNSGSISQEKTSGSEPVYTGTIRKIGSWYNKPNKPPASPSGTAYVAPEMISNRRPRKQSSATLNSDPDRVEQVERAERMERTGKSEKPEIPGYDFGSNLLSDDRIANTIDVQSTPPSAKARRKPPPDSPVSSLGNGLLHQL